MANFKITRNDELMHYRTKGSRNGVRLYQNPDGSLTPLGERHYRDMYGYGERDNGVRKAIDDPGLRSARSGQTFEDTPYVRISGKSLFPDNKWRNPPTERVKIDEYAPYVRISGKSLFPDKSAGSTQPAAGGKQTSGASTSSKNVSPEYLEELNYNSKKNVYPSNSSQISPQEKRGTPGTAGKPLSSNAWRFGLTDFDVYGQGQQPENVSKKESVLKKAYDSATNWVVDRADDVKKGATDAYNTASRAVGNAYNDASKWVVERADDVKKGATDAYNTASKAVVDTADKAKKGVSDAYDATSKAVVDAADKVKTGATDAYNKASEAVVKVGDDIKKGATDAYNAASKAVVDATDKAKGALDQAYKDAEKWVTTAADDVKKTASEAFDAGKEWVEQAGKDVGDFVNNAVSDVTKAVDDAKNGVVDAANTVGKAAQDGWNWVKGLFGGGNDQDEKKK